MKILVATGIYPPQIGGPATYSKTLFEELPKRGVSVTVANFGDYLKYPKVIRHLAYFFHLLSKVSARPNLIYAQDPVSVGVPAAVVAWLSFTPLYLKIVGDYAWEQGQQRFGVKDLLDDFSVKNDYARPVRFLKFIQKLVAKRAKKIIVPSEYLKRIVGNWGIPLEKTSVIYNAFETDDNKKPEAPRLAYKKSVSGEVLVSIGRLVPWKGFKTLITIAPRLLEFFPNLKIFILGDGPDRAKLEDLIIANQLQGKVVLTGQVKKEEVLAYLRLADVFVLNTAYEGFSHQLLEAMSVGTPIVTTEVGGNVELIKDNENGLLVPYNNENELIRAIVRFLRDRVFTELVIENGLKTMENFTKERMIEGLIKELK